ncbi:MAG: LytTR family transcriptional regulator [Candidatus Competibacteraceae bacterium]|nr:LytTR family transcriptional regulator [Candidatus Competibacteraceae bacterium]
MHRPGNAHCPLHLERYRRTTAQNQFVRIHKSSIVAIDRISKIDQNFVYVTLKADGKERDKMLSIGDNYKRNIMELLHQNPGKKAG